MKKIKKIKKAILNFIKWNIIGKSLSKKQQYHLKMHFRSFFEGYGDYIEPVTPICITVFGITNFRFREFKDKIVFEITLERPGILIGKGGRVIDSIKESLSSRFTCPVEIEIIESKLWRLS